MHKSQNYRLYVFNFHGSPLNSIRDEFRKRVQTGVRRRVFLIDLEEEAKVLATKVRNTKRFDDFSVALSAIERCRNEYASISKAIADEQKFSLIDFWMENLNVPTGASFTKKISAISSKKSLIRSPEKAKVPEKPEKGGRGTKTSLMRKKSVLKVPVCPNLVPKQHNKVGRPAPLSKKRYIQDEPEDSELFILIVGDVDNEFYIKLLSHHEPLRAIVHFLPDECGYDILLPHPENKEILAKTLEDIQVDIFEMRAMAITKPTGYMQHYLPVISRCLAEKYSQEIFDQLSYYLYDIELLYKHYQLYYMKAFHITNVEMPSSVNVEALRETAESLAIQGSYLTKPLPAMTSDTATITIYFEGLMNQIAQRSRKLTPIQAQISTLPYRQASQLSFSEDFRDLYTTAFDSILKVKFFERLCIVEDNHLFRELLLFTRTESFENIHYTSLEYNAMRSYTDNVCVTKLFKMQSFDELADRDFFLLPYYAKLYFGANTIKQNLQKWLTEYETHDVDEILPGYRLYHFKRSFNEVTEEQQVVVLPSRLCFRDFTLFQMEEFLEALVTPEMIKARQEQSYSSFHSLMQHRKDEKYLKDLDLSIFIRPTSLKWQKLKAYITAQLTEAAEQATGAPITKPPIQPIQPRETRGRLESDEKPGLPKNHPLLKGYNLEDIRQEIQLKSSKYYFEEGSLELYEERWCFTDMNKNLVFKVNGNTFNIFRPRFWNTAVSSCLRFANEHEVVVRVLNKEDECAKVVINYPNGLAIYHNETYVEQEWYTDETVNREQKRMYVAEGAVIVHYQAADMILVMRYNGEVYRLYQYEFPEEEEEAYNEMTDEFDSSLKIELRDSTMQKDKETTRRTQRDSRASKEVEQEKVPPKAKGKSAREKEEKSTRRESATAKTAKGSKIQAEEPISQRSMVLEEPVKHKTAKELIIESIDNELRFLNEITKKYGLTYLHLIVTTSMGFIINLTHRGKVYRDRSDPTLEWHDYYANEAYAQRGDGVRMIWTADSLKCYHQDGTLIVTALADKIITLEFDTETPFTMSSSHMEEEYVGDDSDDIISTSRVLVDGRRSKGSGDAKRKASLVQENNVEKKSIASTHTRSRVFSTISHYLLTGEGEEARYDDPSYVTYRYDCFHMFHKRYAEVKFELYEVPINDIVVSIRAIDGICAYIYKILPSSNQLLFDEYTEIPNFTTTMGGDTATGNTQRPLPRTSGSKSYHTDGSEVHTTVDSVHSPEEEFIIQTVVKVSFGSNFSMSTTEDACGLIMDLERFDEDKKRVRDTLEFHFDYVKNITDLFQYFVDEISKFKNYPKAKSKEFYFLEHQNMDCHMTGFRFVCDVPSPTEYNFSASNTFTELKKFKNIQELMSFEYPWYDNDMKKFPRFRLRRDREPLITETFPFVLMANIYVKIPQPLCNTAEIHKFADPIENFTFKAMQRFLKEALEYYLRPRIRIELAKLWSTNNWRIKLDDHKGRLFREQQRTVLYKAMLKHNVYPKYHQFQNEFYGHVKGIDFFKFIIHRCMKTPEQLEEEEMRLRAEERAREREEARLAKAYRDSPPPEPKEPPKDGLARRHRKAKYRFPPPPKCITTITHITDKVNYDD